jgi:CO/xanthine dehydrogenase FAD-binding subunit
MELFEYRRAGSDACGHPGPGNSRGRPRSGPRRATDVRGTHDAEVQYFAGGTNLTDYMILGVAKPRVLVDINELRGRFGLIDSDKQRLRLGALARMSEVEDHPAIRRDYPVIAQTLMLAASRQIRNMASLGGNVLRVANIFARPPGPATSAVPARVALRSMASIASTPSSVPAIIVSRPIPVTLPRH